MLTDHEKFRVQDQGGKNDFFFEVNFNKEDEKTNDCKVVKVVFPNKQEAYIKREHLHAILFAIGNEEQQQKLIPQKVVHSRWYETILSVKATKDIRKGEQITFPVRLSMPDQTEEVIGDLKKKVNKGIIVPK